MKHEFPTEWYRLLNTATNPPQTLLINQDRFPYHPKDTNIAISEVAIYQQTDSSNLQFAPGTATAPTNVSAPWTIVLPAPADNIVDLWILVRFQTS